MTQEELMKDLEDKETETLDTYTQGYTEAVDALDKGYANVDATLDAGQQMLQKANQDQLDYTIDEIERQKAQAQKDYEKEQKASFVDYQKQIDPYGANAEKMVSAGLDNSGFAESSKVAMYNQHQQRVAVARESMQRSIAEYNAQIAQARVSNSVAMAQLAYDTLMKKMQYTTEKMLKKNDLLITMTEGQTQIKQNATNRWLDTLGRLNSEEESGDLPIDKGVDPASLDFGGESEDDFDGQKYGKYKMVTYNNVKEYLEELGVPSEQIAKLLKRGEWNKIKNEYKDENGKTVSYYDYLNAVIKKYGGFEK